MKLNISDKLLVNALVVQLANMATKIAANGLKIKEAEKLFVRIKAGEFVGDITFTLSFEMIATFETMVTDPTFAKYFYIAESIELKAYYANDTFTSEV